MGFKNSSGGLYSFCSSRACVANFFGSQVLAFQTSHPNHPGRIPMTWYRADMDIIFLEHHDFWGPDA